MLGVELLGLVQQMEELGFLPISGQVLFGNGHSGISAEAGLRGQDWVVGVF